MIVGLPFVLGLLLAAGSGPASGNGSDRASPALSQLARGHDAFRDGDYDRAARLLAGLAPRLPRVKDYVLYFGAESEFLAGRPARARPLFVQLEKIKSSRLAEMASFRVADCLWQEGARSEAVARYRRLLGANAEGQRPAERPTRTRMNSMIAGGTVLPDEAVGRFRVALALEEAVGKARPAQVEAARQRAARAFRAVNREFPAHPLAEEAGRKASSLEPSAPVPAAGAAPQAAPSGELPVRDRLVRAENLAEQRHLEAAVAELEKLGGVAMPAELAAERDFLLGMTIFKMRQDYGRAAKILLKVVQALPPDKAATAAFHGTRALSRVHRDDEAVAGYRQVVSRFGSSRWAPEAQFLAGRLELNRGRLKEAKVALEETVRRFPRSTFAEEAAWLVALSNVLLGEGQEALGSLDRYVRLAGRGDTERSEAARRATYFRGRALTMLKRPAEARAVYQELLARAPFTYYGVMAAAQLRASGQPATVDLPSWNGSLEPPRRREDALLGRVDDLTTAGLTTEAGLELVRGESALMGRLGRDRAMSVLFDRYPRTEQWRRAYQLAEIHGDAALAAEPRGPARVFWEASYPRAFPALVEKYAEPAGNPEFFLLSIMRKESGFLPTEVSYADARGLVQLIPPTGARLATEIGLAFSPEQLFMPETSIRLGARYLGGIARKFRGNIALAAGAYNAGAGPMMRWCDQHGKRPLDEFVELVTYEQSREYIKRVVGIQSRYHYLYRGKPLELALPIEGCRYLPTGPDY
jgi:soluble lytic murein transglycosylase